MNQQLGAFVYDFNRTYYENAYGNMLRENKTKGRAATLFNSREGSTPDQLYWYDSTWGGAGQETVNDIFVDSGVDIKKYVQNIYNGDQPLCMIDSMFKEITEAVWGSLGLCSVGQVIYDIIDSFTDLFGTFICTATVKAGKCGEQLVEVLKEYRDEVVPNLPEGKKMARYYTVVGPKIVSAIEEDPYKDDIYRYLGMHYVSPLMALIDKNDYKQAMKLYFTMMDEMVKKYGITTSSKFKQWCERYSSGL